MDRVVGYSEVPILPDPQIEGQVDDGRAANDDVAPPPPQEQAASEKPVNELTIASGDRLDEIYENARKQREADEAQIRAENGDPVEPPQQGEPQEQAPIEEPQAQEAPRFRVKVDGREAEVDLNDLIRNYQINTAADRRLQEAAAAKAQAERFLQEAAARAAMPTPRSDATAPQGAQQQPPQTGQTSTPKGMTVTPDELREAIEQIQLGTTEQGAQALEKILSKVAAPSPLPPQQPIDIGSQVERVIAEKADDKTSEVAVERFFQHYPLLAEDEVAQGALTSAARLEMMRDFASRGIPEEALRQVSPEVLADTHRNMRMRGEAGFRQTHEILASVAQQPRFQNFANGYGMRPIQVDIDRGDRKQMVQQQPTLRTAPQRAPAPPEKSQEQRNSDWVAQMRKERGLAPA